MSRKRRRKIKRRSQQRQPKKRRSGKASFSFTSASKPAFSGGLLDRLLGATGIRAGEALQFPSDFPKFPAEIVAYGEKRRASLSPDERRAQVSRHYEKGTRLFSNHQFRQAIPEFQRALVLMTEDMAWTAPIFNLAQCYANLSQYDDFRAVMRFYMELEPDDPEPYFSLAYHALLEEDYEEVIRLSKEGRKRVKGRDAIGLINLARAYAHLGRYPESLRTLEEAVRIAPDWADAYQCLGACYEDMMDLERAKEYYRKAAELDPAHRPNLERLERGIIILGGPPPPRFSAGVDEEWNEEDDDG